MSNQWLRLWHDMPNDPKWRTIARISKQRIGDVMAVYMHMLAAASQHVTRGHVDVTAEDLASAIDVTEDVIQAILTAMQGRVLDGDRLTGWEKRQPKREDAGDPETGAKSSAERKREQREREKALAQMLAQTPPDDAGHDASRKVTTDKDKEEDKEKNKDSVAKATDGKPSKADKPPKSPEDIAKAQLWRAAVSVLDQGGCKNEAQARTFMGKLVVDYTFAVVKDAVAAAVTEQPVDAREYLKAACQHAAGQRQKPNKQEALEASNQAVAARFLEKENHVAH